MRVRAYAYRRRRAPVTMSRQITRSCFDKRSSGLTALSRPIYVGIAPTRPLSLNKSNGSELNADVLSLFRRTTCSASASIHYNTLKVRKIYSYSDSLKFVKISIVFFLQTDSSNSFMKIIYTGAYMILGAQNRQTFSQCRVCNLTSVSFRRHFLVCDQHVKLVLCVHTFSVSRAAAVLSAVSSFLATVLRFFE